MDVSICDSVYLHSVNRCALSRADLQDSWHGMLETV